VDLGLKGKVAVVAASSAGIGRAAAEAFAGEGCRVVVNGRHGESLHHTAEEIRSSTGAEVEEVVGDVSRSEDCRQLVDRAVARFGGIDALVTNAGGPPSKPFDQLSDEDWERAFDLTLMSNVHLIREALPHLRRTRGAIVNVTSYVVKQPDKVMVLSDTLRIGVVALSKAISEECAADGVRLNNVAPGLIWTDRQKQLTEVQAEREGISFDEALKGRESSVPLKRFGTPKEMGDTIAFLCSPAAGYITGQTLLIDGGLAKGIF
jgi:3-oxoacyl-[acyl-carrier protein] reductase